MAVSIIEAYTNQENASDLADWHFPIAFGNKRHSELIEGSKTETETWRMKERMKTVSVALVLCLNVGVDPPDIMKTEPCAALECWIDPMAMSPQKALEAIGSNIQKQYERWQPRARYKQSLDPTVDEVKKLCISLRRNAKEERVLFHYNGHGVPKPTVNGEIWVFNKSYTQYIPLSIYDLQTWMGSPSIYVYDCSSAGTIIDAFKQFANQHESEYEQHASNQNSLVGSSPMLSPSYKGCIQLGACSSNQILPMNAELPADLFTSCLTTPIKVALRWFVVQKTTKLVPGLTLELIDKIPGQLNDRRTMLGELNWIFTAITDTIAWNVLPRELFQRLFRQDLLVASLFRNFLLAERIMRSYNCNPVSSPKLPVTNQHPMWQAWDLALDICLTRLPAILERGEDEVMMHSSFFAEQLTAFQVWLTFGSNSRNPPEQLPIVLQVLLSQVHRLKALDLLGRFLDLGPWAVNLALSVGIFPYVLKLLQSTARELRPFLVFIWAKILAVDSTCQADLVRDNGHKYFLTVLEDLNMPSEHRTMAAFVLACIVNNYTTGQEAARQGNLISICLDQLPDSNPFLRQWLAICLGRVWLNFETARWCGVRDSAHEKLYNLLTDSVPEVRAAAVYALGTFMSSVAERSDHANTIDHSIAMTLIKTVAYEASPIVRQEIVVALHWVVLMFENQFVNVAYQFTDEEKQRDNTQSPASDSGSLSLSGALRRHSSRDKMKFLGSPVSAGNSGLSTSSGSLESSGVGEGGPQEKIPRVSSHSAIMTLGSVMGTSPYMSSTYSNIHLRIWQKFVDLSNDPYIHISEMATTVVKYISNKVSQALVHSKEVTQTKSASFSAPSSPSSKPSFISGESPPTNININHHDLPRPLKWLPRQQGFPRIQRSMERPSSSASNESDDPSNARTALITTEFVDWCCKYFMQSMMKFPEETDPESATHQEREWRFLRNAKLRRQGEEEQKKAVFGRLDDQVFINRNTGIPSVLKMHPFEPVLVVADRDNSVSVWDWEQGTNSNTFLNHNPKPSRITSMEFVNPHDLSLLLLGSDDGAVRLWRNYMGDDGKEVGMVTAWQALNEMTPTPRGPGLVMEWDQETCRLYTSGDSRVIRIWDAESEQKLQDIPTGADSCVTSLSCDSEQPLLVAGCGDGSVRLYDTRLSQTECRVTTFREHSAWVVNVQIQKKPEVVGKIISGSIAGDVRFWDVRNNASIMTHMAAQGMTAMAVHSYAEVFACGSANQFINVYTCTGENLSVIKYHDGFMGQRIGPISCLHFHPHKVILAAGSTDNLISVYALDKKR